MSEQQLAVVLEMDAATAAELRAAEVACRMLEGWAIDCRAMAEAASKEMRKAITQIAQLKAKKAEFVKPAKAIIATAEGMFDPAIDALDGYQRGLKALVQTWTTEQERLAEEAKRKADEEARRRRQEAEQKAAAERAKAEQEAAEQRRVAREAEEARARAEREGNAKAAAQAAAAAARATEKAVAVVENADVKATELVLAAEASVPVVEAPKKIAGFSTRENWLSEFVDGKDEVSIVPLLIATIGGVTADKFKCPELCALLKFDQPAANKLAKALKLSMAVPGLRAVNRPVAASRAA